MKKRMKKLNVAVEMIICIVVIALAVVSVDYATEGSISTPKADFVSKVQAAPIHTDNLDVLAIGNSNLYSGVNPLKMYQVSHLQSFVIGEASQSLMHAYYALKVSLTHIKPKMVMLEVSSLFGVKNYDSVSRSLHLAKKNCLPLLKGNQGKVKLSVYDRLRFMNHGYVYRYDCIPFRDTKYMSRRGVNDKMTKQGTVYFKKMIALCKKNKIPVLAIAVPSAKDWNQRKYLQAKALLKKLHIRFLDMNQPRIREEMSFDLTNSFNDVRGTHCSVVGANRVSGYLASYIEKYYHLTGQVSKDWDKEVEKEINRLSR